MAYKTMYQTRLIAMWQRLIELGEVLPPNSLPPTEHEIKILSAPHVLGSNLPGHE